MYAVVSLLIEDATVNCYFMLDVFVLTFLCHHRICTGILDQGTGVLVVFDETPSDKTYEASLETIQSMGKVVDALYVKTKKLT